MERTVLEPEAAAIRACTRRPSRRRSCRTVRGEPERVALRTRGGEREITWGEYGELVDSFALGAAGDSGSSAATRSR